MSEPAVQTVVVTLTPPAFLGSGDGHNLVLELSRLLLEAGPTPRKPNLLTRPNLTAKLPVSTSAYTGSGPLTWVACRPGGGISRDSETRHAPAPVQEHASGKCAAAACLSGLGLDSRLLKTLCMLSPTTGPMEPRRGATGDKTQVIQTLIHVNVSPSEAFNNSGRAF